MMRILFAATGYTPADRIGGPVASLSALAQALTSRGHKITVLCTNNNLDRVLDVPTGVPTSVDGVEVWYFPFRNLRYIPARSSGFVYSPCLRDELRRQVPDCDIVHTQLPFTYPTAAAIRIASRCGKPVVYHQHGVFSPERLRYGRLKKKMYLTLIERGNLKKADVLIALTDAEAEWYRKLGCRNRIEIVPNGVHLPELKNIEPWRHPGIPERAPIVLFMARLHPLKGPQRLIGAFSRVLSEIPGAHLVIAGPDETGMVPGLKELARNMSNRVHFAGMVSGPEKSRLLRRASVLCLPSTAEGFSMAVLEALAHATPVVISPGCHFPRVKTAGAGFVADNDPGRIADSIVKVLGDPGMTPYCAAARRLVEKEFGWDRIAARMEEIYISLPGTQTPQLHRA